MSLRKPFRSHKFTSRELWDVRFSNRKPQVAGRLRKLFRAVSSPALIRSNGRHGTEPSPKPAADDPFAAPAETSKEPAAAGETKPKAEAEAPDVSLSADPPGLTRLVKDAPLWIDMKRKLVVVDGEVVMREGLLEMFACPKGTKEHESVVMTTCKPHFVHTALLALGLKPGSGAKFDPMYVPAKGPIVDIFILWKDSDGKDRAAGLRTGFKV